MVLWQVWPEVIKSHVMAELPFMATEVILMACVKVRTVLLVIIDRACYYWDSLSVLTSLAPHPHSLWGSQAGGDRQDLHEAIRVHSMEAGAVVKAQGKPNDLLQRIAADPRFAAVCLGREGCLM